jgi:nucleotide-binding universal stress UspA family protein
MTAQFAPSTLPVVVGVDGSDSARRALVWATGEARRRKVGLHLVTAFAWAAPHGRTGLSERYRTELMDRAGRQVLAEAVAAAKEVAPGLEMTSSWWSVRRWRSSASRPGAPSCWWWAAAGSAG